MKKYLAIALTRFKEAITWRGHIFVWILVGFMEIGVYPFILLTAYAHDPSVGGLTRDGLITYYFLLPLVSGFTISFAWDNIVDAIQNGSIGAWLVQPIHVMWRYFWGELGEKVVRALLTLFPMIVLYPFLQSHIHLVHVTAMSFFLPVVLFVTVVMTFLIAAMMGIVAAWTTQIWWIIQSWFVIVTFVGGFVAPYSLYPEWIRTFLSYTPFPLLTQTPLAILMGTTDVRTVLRDILIGFFWIGFLIFTNHCMWRRGLRRVESVGL